MKPHVICHMAASVDGKTLLSRWKPEGHVAAGLFERLHNEFTATPGSSAASPDKRSPRAAHIPRRPAEAFTAMPGSPGATQRPTAWCWMRRARSLGAARTSVAIRSSPSSRTRARMRILAGLRSEGVSYLFAGRTGLDLGLTLEQETRS